MPEHIGSLALRKGGGAVVALGDGFYTLNFDTGTSTKLVDPDPGKPRIRLNDGKVDRQGRFVAGYMDYEEREPLCSVFRLDINHTVTPLDRGTVCPNGPCRSPDGRTFYFADTYCREIWAYDYDTATATSLTAASLPLTPLPISVDCRMARPSMPRASCGVRPSTKASSCASPRMGRWTARWRTRRASYSAAPPDIAYVTSMAQRREGSPPTRAGIWGAVRGLRARRPWHSGAALPGLMSSWANPIWNSLACRGASGIATRAILV